MGNQSLNDRIYYSYADISRGSTPLFAQNITFAEAAQSDAFGRMRVSTPDSIFDNYEIQGKKTLFWSENSVGTTVCTHVANESSVQFAASTTSGNKVTRSSKKLSLYTPGSSLMVLATGVMGAGQTGSAQRIGFFNAENGIFFEQRDGIMGAVIRSNTTGSAVDNRVAQSDWNIDKMDGTGPSGAALDFTKTQIFWFDLEWLGVGRVRCGFVHQGKIFVCHEFYHNNALTTVYMKTPLLPVTYEIENLTAVTTALDDFRQICCSVIREGGESTTHKHRNANCGVTPIAVTSTTLTPVICLKIATGYVGKGMIKPENISVLTQGNKDVLFEVVYGGTVQGGTFVTAPSGIGMYNITATNLVGGTKLAAEYVASSDHVQGDIFDKNFWLGGEITGTADTLSVIARSITGVQTATVLASIDYKEVY